MNTFKLGDYVELSDYSISCGYIKHVTGIKQIQQMPHSLNLLGILCDDGNAFTYIEPDGTCKYIKHAVVFEEEYV